MSNLESLLKQLINLYKVNNLLKEDNYHFEDYPSTEYSINLRYIRTIYEFLKNNMSELSIIESELFAKYVHSTTSIEGITLNLQETQNILSESGLPSHNKHFHDSQAILNYKSVKQYDSLNHEL